jgi:hypothetical protein
MVISPHIAQIRHELRLRGIRGVTVTASPSGETCGPITMRFPDGTEAMGYEKDLTKCLAQCADLHSLRQAVDSLDLRGADGDS